MRPFKFIILIFIGLFIMIGCPVELKNAVNKNSADVPYVVQLMQKAGTHKITLNLADDKQYEFAKSRLALAGRNIDNAPSEYKALEQVRNEHKRLPIPTNLPLPPIFLAQDHMISKIFSYPSGDPKQGTYTAEATSTVKDGSFYSYVDLIVYDENWQQISPYAYAEEYNKGQLVTATVNRPFPKVDSIIAVNAVSYEKTVVNGQTIITATWEPGLIGPGAGVNTPMFAIYEPTDKDGNKIIDVCIDRNVYLYAPPRKCDFAPLPSGEQYRHTKVPFKGVLRLPYIATAANLVPEETYIKLIPADMGGSTRMTYKGDQNSGFGVTNLKFAVGAQNTTLVSWDIPREDAWFENGDLVKEKTALRGRLVHWYIKLTFNLPGMAPGLPSRTLSFLCSSDPIPLNYDPTPNITTQLPPPPGIIYSPIAFWWSCLAEGTMISMIDGKLVPIENIKEGDIVKGPKGVPLSVIGKAVGKEQKPMIRVVDQYVHDLLLTENHPVKTYNKGIVRASELKEGDIIDTEQGPSVIKFVSKDKFEGNVYNLFLGTTSELADLPPNSNMLYADGILVGDAAMQSCPACFMEKK